MNPTRHPCVSFENAKSLSTEVRERPKLLADLSAEAAKLIEDVTVDRQGR